MVVVELQGARSKGHWFAYGLILFVGSVIWILCAALPAELPFWMPWEFSWPVFLAVSLSLLWFFSGLAALPGGARPPLWRSTSFLVGVLSMYVVLQTRFDYLAQHMFFVHRWAHFVLHHAGAFLIALGTTGPVLRAGMPAFARSVIDLRAVRRTVDFVQHASVAPVLFIGLLYFWLIPQIHTRVMLDRNLYDLMNWSMAIDGILFWLLILDPRPKPPARLTFLVRFLLIIAIEIPQMFLGAILSLSVHDFYPVYQICGRVLEMTPLTDQHYGGLIIWLPGTVTSFAAAIVILLAYKSYEEQVEHAQFMA